MRLRLPLQMAKFAHRADTASGIARNLKRLHTSRPHVAGDQPTMEGIFARGKELKRLSNLQGSYEVNDGTEHTDGIAGLIEALLGLGAQEASETSGPARAYRHGQAVTTDSGRINPRPSTLNGKIVDQQTSFKVIGAIQDEVCRGEQLLRILWS